MNKNKNTVITTTIRLLMFIAFSINSTASVLAYTNSDSQYFLDQLGVTKSVYNTSTNSESTASPTDVLQWQIDLPVATDFMYSPNLQDSLNSNVNFTEGSLKVPNGFSTKYSEDSINYTESEPSAVKALKILGSETGKKPLLIGKNSMTQNLSFDPGITSIYDTDSGGDGYVPFVIPETDKVMIFYHKVSGSNPGINCFHISSGLKCAGYPKNLDASSGYPGNYTHSYHQNQVNYNGKIYITGQNLDDKTWGIDCWDSNTDSFCGYFQMSNNWNSTVKLNQAEDKLYFIADNKLQCFDVSTNLICTSPWQNIAVPGQANETYQSEIYGNFLISASQGSGVSNLLCFDLSSLPAQSCQGYPKTSNIPINIPIPYQSAAGNTIGFCSYLQCFDFAGNALPIPSFISNSLPYNMEVTALDSKVYVSDNSKSTAWCWDFAIDNFCANFMDSDMIPGKRAWNKLNQDSNYGMVNAVSTNDYGYSYFEGCMYGLGDNRTLWSFDPETGHSPCSIIKGGISINDSADNYYCDNGKHSITFNTITIPANDAEGLPIYPELKTLNYVVSANGDALASGSHDFSQDLEIDLSQNNIDIGTQVDLIISYIGTTQNQIQLEASYIVNDPLQICYTSTQQDQCTIGPVNNTVNIDYLIPVQSTDTGDIKEDIVVNNTATDSIDIVGNTQNCGQPTTTTTDPPKEDISKPTLVNTGMSHLKYIPIAGLIIGLVIRNFMLRRPMRINRFISI